ncbi:Pantothenate kinase CAB1 [Ceratocystis fimbriata CBS 114723]|uniref:Pantothenate kinase CAB1 n=1 Tax=Ceratocystis fimbriata CBS 114723 TaxID=1035309 RepID=A0A2C5WY62_9PEZI|nr:Pantothenate kinase CAB1 [Ceratocystis fimbriata CBS 114723]
MAAPRRTTDLPSSTTCSPSLGSKELETVVAADGALQAGSNANKGASESVSDAIKASVSVSSPAQIAMGTPSSVASSRAAVSRGRARTQPSVMTDKIDTTITQPGAVRINVTGAFIVDSADPKSPSNGSSPSRRETSDIRLPNHTAVVSHIAVDIGGSLAKLVYFSREPSSSDPGGRLNFINFETDRIDECIDFMAHIKDEQLALNGSTPNELSVIATGGGAYKFYDKIRAALGGVDVVREDEMECLIIGLDFFISEIPREVFTYSEADPMAFVEPSQNIYPYLLVNIGSGVSFLKVSGPRQYERVGGTSLGGGTLWGLLSLLTGARTFDDMLAMADEGDNSKVDMLVGDIYGTDYGKIGLKSTTIASSFGKVFRMKREAEENLATKSTATDSIPDASTSLFSPNDVSRSILYAISNNIGQIAYLQSQIHGLSHIYFGGSFIRGHRQTINTLSYAIKFWSKGQKEAYFLRHEGYLGSVGAFLKRQPRNWGRRGSLDDVRPAEARRLAKLAADEDVQGGIGAEIEV